PPQWLRSVVSSSLSDIIHYPDPDNSAFIDAIASAAGVNTDAVVAGNGTTELLYLITRVLQVKRALIPVPSYIDYIRASRLGGLVVETIALRKNEGFILQIDRLREKIRQDDLVIIGTPNNPTGTCCHQEELLSLAAEYPQAIFLFDEAFLDFTGEGRSLSGKLPNIITINSMTKFYAVPGLRIGYGVFAPQIAAAMRKNMPPWTVNSLAQAVGTKALEDVAYRQETREYCRQLRLDLANELGSFTELRLYPSSANYLFLKILNSPDSEQLAIFCLDHGIMIRRCDNYIGLDESFIRIAVRTERENRRLVSVFSKFFKKETKKRRGQKKTPAVMFQGTCSDAGKSIMTAALCRILFQDGVKVAPFKAQNMSLNSFVTLQGDEMGRAQVVQAQAARLDPDCRMNPILLKPNSDTGSQIIVQGQPVGNMSVLEYDAFKPKAWLAVQQSFNSLADEYDALVLEGAGSPGEVNLKANDIVNMKMARYAESPVILVGDIDRGGVYASFVGTMEVLNEWERDLVAGFMVNKFRGQSSLLDAAHTYVKNHTGRPVLGVIPYLAGLGLPEEDSVSFKKGLFNREKEREDSVEIVVLNLPHISNFTDIEPFLDEPDAYVRIVSKAADVGNPQVIILPGSKNVIHDLHYLKEEGFIEVIRKNIEAGCEMVGICGGYMMLGEKIEDPHAIESAAGEIAGLGQLPMTTVIKKSKRLTRVDGLHQISGTQISGYEIHHGISTDSEDPLFIFNGNSSCGTADESGRIWGCYLHGVFDSDQFRRWFIDRLRSRIGMQPLDEIVAPYDLEAAFDRLADCVRENCDLDEIYRLLGL
ncbi:MAG: cobyric acid synthase, partial [Deltaproteobacteria bacterium]|nr:cobyric acid synthase [Deltaproteobacteria bacterium]